MSQASLGIRYQCAHIHSLAGRGEPAKVFDAPAPFARGATVVAAKKVIAAHSDQQYPLVEVANVVGLIMPECLERLMLLEILPTIELLDSFEKLRGRRQRAESSSVRP